MNKTTLLEFKAHEFIHQEKLIDCNWDYKINGKLQSQSLFFTPYINLVPNLLIVSIWSLTFLVLCQFGLCHYHLDGKTDVSCEIIKKLFFMPHQRPTIPPHQVFFFLKNQIKSNQIPKIPNSSLSLSLSLVTTNQTHLHLLPSP